MKDKVVEGLQDWIVKSAESGNNSTQTSHLLLQYAIAIAQQYCPTNDWDQQIRDMVEDIIKDATEEG